MSKSRDKGRLGPFVPLMKETLRTEAWRATSHGARSLYVTLKSHYNRAFQNAVYVSTRDAAQELGSNRDFVRRWFRELQHYGFIVMETPGCLGVQGMGKAPHYRLTEEWYKNRAPTRDYLKWDGVKYQEQKSPSAARAKKQNPGPTIGSRLDAVVDPPTDAEVGPVAQPGGRTNGAIEKRGGGPTIEAITNLTTPIPAGKLTSRSAERMAFNIF